MDRINDGYSGHSDSHAYSGSPHGVCDPPGYSMFQERAPWALVTGEEHFTFLGYHSKRWCQGPSENFLGSGAWGTS